MSVPVGATTSRTRTVVVLGEESEVLVVTQAVAVMLPSTRVEVLMPLNVTVPAPAVAACVVAVTVVDAPSVSVRCTVSVESELAARVTWRFTESFPALLMYLVAPNVVQFVQETPVGAAAISAVADLALSGPVQPALTGCVVYCHRPTGTLASVHVVAAIAPLQAAAIVWRTP